MLYTRLEKMKRIETLHKYIVPRYEKSNIHYKVTHLYGIKQVGP